MSIASEIERLQEAKADIKTSIETKGVSVPSSAKLDDYSDYIDNIPSGGSTPQNYTELNQVYYDTWDVILDRPNHYEAYTNNPITLYTPNADYKLYAITRRSSNKYRVHWFKTNRILQIYDTSTLIYGYPTLTSISSTGDFSNWDRKLTIGKYNYGIYNSGEYNSIAECINAIQSNSTTYTLFTTSSGGAGIYQSNVYYTNAPLYNHVNNYDDFIDVEKLSKSETIQTIS